MVNDRICGVLMLCFTNNLHKSDCCDGTDEWNSGITCQNVCNTTITGDAIKVRKQGKYDKIFSREGIVIISVANVVGLHVIAIVSPLCFLEILTT